jgi:hypothetical protein
MAVNFQDDGPTVAEHWKANGLSFPTFLQQGDSASRAFGVEFYTSMFLLDGNFQVQWRNHKLIEPEVKKILGMKP